MMEKAVMVEHEGGGVVLFWAESDGSLGWVASAADGGLRELVAEMELPGLEWYRCSADGSTVYPAAGNLRYEQQTTRHKLLTFTRQLRRDVLKRRERIARFARILRGEL